MEGVYPETRIGFTRPRDWELKSAKALIRFQHSPSLLGDRSHLIVRVNNTSVGSVPLNRENSQVGQVLFNIPPNLIQDYNEVSILAEQQTSETCTNPADPTLWTEVLPDSKLLFDFEPQAIALDFSRYPYPFLDDLSLDANRLTYLRPAQLSETWLTATSRFQTAAGQFLGFRSLNTRLVEKVEDVEVGDRLMVIGTPTEQAVLADLSLPFPLRNNRIVDGDNNPLPGDVGVLMLSSLEDNGVPVLVATGNAPEGVLKAVQFLVQSQDQQIGTGQALLVNGVTNVPTPSNREWKGYLPAADTFRLSDLDTPDRQPFEDKTVYGSNAPPVQINFRALPDDRFLRGSKMTLRYSYSSQVDPRTSAVEVKLDDVTIASRRLSDRGGRDAYTLDLPGNLIEPDTRLDVQFILNPRRSSVCGLTTDQQLWGTVHGDTSFNLSRDNVFHLPDLKLLRSGFPLTAPQDLSATAIVLPDRPNDPEVLTLLAFSERMGRITQADSVKSQVYLAGTLPATVRSEKHLVGIGRRDRLPFPEALQSDGLNLRQSFFRQRQESQIQALPDQEGVIQAVLSPWNGDRLLLALTGQTERGLEEVGEAFRRDSLFSQLQGDTVMIRRNQANPSPYNAQDYSLNFLQQTRPRRIEHTTPLNRASLFLQDYWFMLPTGIVLLALLLYGISQLYLNRLTKSGDVQ